VQLTSPTGNVGTPLTTFFVFSPPTTGTHKLAFSLSLPVNAAPRLGGNATAVAPSAAASSELARLSRTLASFPSVPVSLDVTPQTVAALATGSKADRDTMRTLAGVVSHGDELLPSPYVRTSLPALGNVGLDSQIDEQLDTGSATLKRLLGHTPDPGTWVFDSPIDEPTLQLLAARGLRRLILPDGDLSPLPSALSTTTYGHPATVPDGLRGGSGPRVVGADPILSGRLTQSGNQVLAAEQLLAELAMIQTESPASARGVAVIVPRGQSVSRQLLTTLLAGLRHDPLVRAVTARNLFASASPPPGHAPSSSSASSSPASPVRQLRGRVPESFPDQLGIASTLSRLASVRTVVPTQTGLFAGVTEQVLLAGSDQISQADRARLLQTANQHLQAVSRQIRVVGATSVTLTSRNAKLPFTIDSLSKVPVHVELLLDSTKLTFKPFKPPDGTCSVRAQTLEECSLVLTASQTAFHLPVQARTTGVFPLDMSLQSPDAALVLTTARVTVRSTAVSFVGWALIVGAGLLLVIWWGRDIHRGRRARQLVDRPEDVATSEAGSVPEGVLGMGGKEAGVVRPVLRHSVLRHSGVRSAVRSAVRFAVGADPVGWRVSPSQTAMGPIVGSGPGRHPEERP
ncbi:MAG TPA: DUF6049 family protein, partial [Acidimicrobiales bacterium]|nr:DUF6049 family protein [Acidimicrobiales bacterium]